MNRVRFSTRDRRAVKWGLAVLLPAVLFTHGVKPYSRVLSERKSRLEHERGLLSRERGLLLARGDLQRSLEVAGVRVKSQADALIAATDAALAESELVAHVQTVALLSGVLVQAADGDGVAESEGPASDLVPIRLELRGETDYEGLALFLSRLESSPSLIRVPSLSIELVDSETVGGASDDRSGVVTFSATVEAHARLVPDRQERSAKPLVASAGGTHED